MSKVSQVERQLYILQLLSVDKWYTVDDILSHLRASSIEVSKKTIERDLDSISMVFFVTEDKINGKVSYKGGKMNINSFSFSFSPTEILSLHFMKEIMKPYKSLSISGFANDLIDQIIRKTPEMNKSYLDSLGDVIKVNNTNIFSDQIVNDTHVSQINQAISQRKAIQITYYSSIKKNVTVRLFKPYIMEVRNGVWYAIGYCEDRKAIRELRLNKIRDISITNIDYKKPASIKDINAFNNINQRRTTKVYPMKLKFKKEAISFIEEFESKNASRIHMENDALIYEKDIVIDTQIERWILSFGPLVEVIEPVILKERIKKHYEDSLKNY